MSQGFTGLLTLIKACRVRHWTKNLLVFAAPLFSFRFNLEVWAPAFSALVAFCFISSSIYLINDSLDIDADRAHPKKKFRPIASASLSIQNALITSCFLLGLGFLIAFKVSLPLLGVLFLYVLIQLAYSLRLKKEPLIDLCCISAGFLLRAIAGGLSAGLYLSPWFILSVGMLALFLAVEKRKAELRISLDTGVVTRKVLERYSLPLLLRLESLVATSSFITYSLWAAGPFLKGASTSWMLLTIPFVLVGIFRYQLLSDPHESARRTSNSSYLSSESPEEILLGDKGIKTIVLSWLLTIITIGIINAI